MRLSIIVPVFNMEAGNRLRYCLDSLIGQSLDAADYEIIAVDDCSTDGSMAVLAEYEKQYPGRLIAIHSPVNHHQGGAKNLGLAIARGEWIGFMDADDWAAPDFYERLLNKAEETGADMVGCDYCMTDRQSMEPGKQVSSNNSGQTGEMTQEKYRKLLLDPGSLVVKIYRRYIILGEKKPQSRCYEAPLPNAGIFPEDIFYEDNAVCKTWMLRSTHFEYIPEPLYYYYQHDASTVHTLSKRNLEDRTKAGMLMLEEARTRGYFEEYRPELEYSFTVLFYINTLFSAMPAATRISGKYGFTKELLKRQYREFPDFRKNPYYLARTGAEEKKLIDMQCRSQLLFYVYYRALWTWRAFRRKIGK